MKKLLTSLIVLSGLFAVIAQYVLMQQNRVASETETIIRFFSFFTILTNSIVALYFLRKLMKKETSGPAEANTNTAITIYITIVGLVYQILLRQLWSPTGLQKLVDELLHSVVPVLVIMYWVLYTEKGQLSYKRIPRWLLFPLVYLAYVLVRGHFSSFYPYPFVNVSQLGMKQVLINSLGLVLVFVGVSALFVSVGQALAKKK